VNTAAPLPKWSDKYPLLKLPVLRGGAVLIQSMGLGIKALNYSANVAFAKPTSGSERSEGALSPAVIEGEGDFAGLTGAVPVCFRADTETSKDELKKGTTPPRRFDHLRADLQRAAVRRRAVVADERAVHRRGLGHDHRAVTSTPLRRSIANPRRANQRAERGTQRLDSVRTYLHPVRPSVAFQPDRRLIRMTFFLIMIFSFSLLKDIRRVFQYHGAEHKTVFTWEAGLPLTVDNARPQPRQHPRCGTSFLMVVMLVAIVLFSVISLIRCCSTS
jgi:hypothetical protein